MHALEKKIRAANAQNRVAVIPFLTAGFPDGESFWKHLLELDASGADIVEIGIPFSDPVADGPVVEDASRRVLRQGVNLEGILEGLKEKKPFLKSEIVLMGYINPFLQYGFENLARDAREAGVSGLIIPDLPFEEQAPLQKLLDEQDIALIPLVGLNTSEERMALYAKNAKGYVYVVSVLGITGERKNIAEGVARTMEQARKIFSAPIALGFGLKHPSQLNELPENARPDAAVFGSALLTHLDAGKAAKDFMAPWLA